MQLKDRHAQLEMILQEDQDQIKELQLELEIERSRKDREMDDSKCQ